MELEVFEGQNKSELSMIEVAHAILAEHGDTMPFADLANAIQEYLGDSNKEIRERLAQFYTDLNVDGSFISLGDNTWGLRTWYPYDSIDEATVHTDDDDEDRPKRKKRRKVNAFLADASDDDDVIDYDDDDPEDQEDEEFVDDEGVAEDSSADLGKYSKDMEDVDDSPDDEDDEDMPDGIEGELTDLDESEILEDDENDNDADDTASQFDSDGDDYDFSDRDE